MGKGSGGRPRFSGFLLRHIVTKLRASGSVMKDGTVTATRCKEKKSTGAIKE